MQLVFSKRKIDLSDTSKLEYLNAVKHRPPGTQVCRRLSELEQEDNQGELCRTTCFWL